VVNEEPHFIAATGKPAHFRIPYGTVERLKKNKYIIEQIVSSND